MRYLSAQFIPYLNEQIWIENAQKSNAAAQQLANAMKKIKEIEITQKVESNAIFFILPKGVSDELRKHYFFYDWDESRNEMRLVCSWDTTQSDINDFISYLQKLTN